MQNAGRPRKPRVPNPVDVLKYWVKRKLGIPQKTRLRLGVPDAEIKRVEDWLDVIRTFLQAGGHGDIANMIPPYDRRANSPWHYFYKDDPEGMKPEYDYLYNRYNQPAEDTHGLFDILDRLDHFEEDAALEAAGDDALDDPELQALARRCQEE